MKPSARDTTWMERLPYFGGLALLVYMPFHVFLVQSLSTLTGGLSVWKVAKDAVTFALVLFVVCLVWWKRRATRGFTWLVGLGLAYALLHGLLWAAHPHIYRTSALVGADFNIRVVAYAVIGYGAKLLYPQADTRVVARVVVGASAVVAALGVVQYFLPPDFLRHFGYSIARGARPGFFIDNNPHYPRVFATLRDPNSFGAYLILPMTLLLSWLLRTTDARRRTIYGALFALEAGALLLTFSRSAWAAALVAFALACWWRWRALTARFVRRWWPLLAVAVVLLGVGIFAERHSPFVKSYVIHSTGKPQGQYDSDGFHWYYMRRGLEGIWHAPLGHGPGTAGLASIQNPHGGLLTENYYVQIGYELGLEGLALFVALNAFLYTKLWRRRDDLAGVLLATFWAYVITNMLLHMWSNEPVALEWWLLAGMAAAQSIQPGSGGSAKKNVKR